ncbi:hypothetical protein ACFPRL_15185 [Pseudoclavibacter helvolus]
MLFPSRLQVRRLEPARRAGGVPEVHDGDRAHEVFAGELVAELGDAAELDRRLALALGEDLVAAVASDGPGSAVFPRDVGERLVSRARRQQQHRGNASRCEGDAKGSGKARCLHAL